MSEASGRPSRRNVIVAAGAGLLALSGCVPGTRQTQPRVDPELRMRARIADEVRALSRQYAAVVAAFPGADAALGAFAAQHDAHARALTGPADPSGLSGRATRDAVESGGPSPGAIDTQPPAELGAALRWLVAAEEAAARRRSAQAVRASPALARLLASIAGCDMAHAALLQQSVGSEQVGTG